MSRTMTFNDALTLTYPDEFHVMDASERKTFSILEDGPGEILSDPDRHMVISVGWKPLKTLTSLLVGANDMAKKTESAISEALQPNKYRKGAYASKNAGGEIAEGFTYEYEAQGIDMYGEAFVVKHKKTFYFLYLYARSDLRGESVTLWNQILEQITWA